MIKGIEKIKQIIAEAIKAKLFSCAHFAVGNRAGNLFSYWTGQRQVLPEAVLADGATLYDLASVTKIMVTTILCLKLIENGELCLSDPLARFYSGLASDVGKITVQDLLTHTSGLGSASLVHLDKTRIDQEILSRPLKHARGSQVEYSCPGFIVLGRLIEKASGEKLAVLAKEQVFAPLGMHDTSFHPASANVAATATDPDLLGLVNDYNARYIGQPVGNAGLFASLADCVKFARMLLGGGQLDNKRIVSARILELAAQDHTPGLNESRGLGFYNPIGGSKIMGELFSQRAFGHGGWTGTSLIVDPELDIYVVLLTNRTHLRSDNYDEMMRTRRLIHNTTVAFRQGI